MKLGRTSECVAAGHPDKVADIISDTILDLVLAKNPNGRCSVETFVCTDEVILRGEMGGCTLTDEEIEEAVRGVVKAIGYVDIPGFSYDTLKINSKIVAQSTDIAQGVIGEDVTKVVGAGDQGIMFGYSTNETYEGLPLQFLIAKRLMAAHNEQTGRRTLGIRPDAKSQVTLPEDGGAATIVLSISHDEGVNVVQYAVGLINQFCNDYPQHQHAIEGAKLLINPTGRFVACGPSADTGLTGRKIVVDAYGGACPVGGGCFSSKDPSKVDRSAAYMARYLANKVARMTPDNDEAEVLVCLSYAIGVAEPTSLEIRAAHLSKEERTRIAQELSEEYDLTPAGIINFLKLKEIKYAPTAYNGHFGTQGVSFPWESF